MKLESISFPFSTDAAAAQRLAKIELEKITGQKTVMAAPRKKSFHDPGLTRHQIAATIRLRELGYSFQRIANAFGVSNVTVTKWVRRAGRADLCGRIAKPPGQEPGPRVTILCRVCRKEMHLTVRLSTQVKFCSRACMGVSYRKT